MAVWELVCTCCELSRCFWKSLVKHWAARNGEEDMSPGRPCFHGNKRDFQNHVNLLLLCLCVLAVLGDIKEVQRNLLLLNWQTELGCPLALQLQSFDGEAVVAVSVNDTASMSCTVCQLNSMGNSTVCVCVSVWCGSLRSRFGASGCFALILAVSLHSWGFFLHYCEFKLHKTFIFEFFIPIYIYIYKPSTVTSKTLSITRKCRWASNQVMCVPLFCVSNK